MAGTKPTDHEKLYEWANEAYRILKARRPHREPHLAEIAKQIMDYHRPMTWGGDRPRDVPSIQRELEGRVGFNGLPGRKAWEKPT